MKNLVPPTALLLLLSASGSPRAFAAPPSPPRTAPAAPQENLAGIAAGAMVVVRPESPQGAAAAWNLFDEDPRTGWTSEAGKVSQPTVIELADRSVIRSVQLDTASIEWDGRLPKQILIEMSDTGPSAGFKPIATVTLPPQMKDGQTFPASAEVPGRWLRMTVKSMQEPAHDIVQIMELKAFGERLTHNPPADVTGTYDADGQAFHLKQDGTTVSGCYDGGTAPLSGGLEGRLLRFTYNTETERGPAVALFGGGRMFMGYWKANSEVVEHPVMWVQEARKRSDRAGDCPQWKPPQDQMGSELKQSGRVRLYGINFDSDSAVIRPESKATLDQVAAMLKANPDLRITVEGHTDSTAAAAHNQQLSEQRANAVKQALVAAGIDASRLTAAGYGATRPVATNDTPLGRAANRRVELAKR